MNFEEAPCSTYGSLQGIEEVWFHAYELDVPLDLGINPVFNVEDLTFYHTPVAYPTVIPNEPALTSRSSELFQVQPLIPPPLRRPSTEEIEDILTDETVSTVAGTYQCYLVRWRRRLDSDCTLLRARRSCNSTQSFYMTFTMAILQRRIFRSRGELMRICLVRKHGGLTCVGGTTLLLC